MKPPRMHMYINCIVYFKFHYKVIHPTPLLLGALASFFVSCRLEWAMDSRTINISFVIVPYIFYWEEKRGLTNCAISNGSCFAWIIWTNKWILRSSLEKIFVSKLFWRAWCLCWNSLLRSIVGSTACSVGNNIFCTVADFKLTVIFVIF